MFMKDLSAKLREITTRWDLRTVHERASLDGFLERSVYKYKADHFRVVMALFLAPFAITKYGSPSST